jgi:hypothetical protein
MFYNLYEIPESADPIGSTRYNCTIMHEKIFSLNQQTFFYDDIEDNGVFIVEEHSPEYRGYEVVIFEGTVLKEKNNEYSWWKRGKIA